jgi:hypothetical protein
MPSNGSSSILEQDIHIRFDRVGVRLGGPGENQLIPESIARKPGRDDEHSAIAERISW